jgi:hypothetical protein
MSHPGSNPKGSYMERWLSEIAKKTQFPMMKRRALPDIAETPRMLKLGSNVSE